MPVAYAQLLLFYNAPKTRERVGVDLTPLRKYYYGSTTRLSPVGTDTNPNDSYLDFTTEGFTYLGATLNGIAGKLCRRISSAFSFLGLGGISTFSCKKATFHHDESGWNMINHDWGFETGEYRRYEYGELVRSFKNSCF